MEAVYCKQYVKSNYHNLYFFAVIGNLLLTYISIELKAVIVVVINSKKAKL